MQEGQNLPSAGRALVPLDSPHPDACHSTVRRDAAFLAHLIATDRHLPQTRERRCAEPAEAVAAYRDSYAKTHPKA